MSNLLQVLEQKAKSMDVQIKKARTVTIDEATWIKTKKYVDQLPANLDTIARMIADCENITKGDFGKCKFQGKCHRSLITLQAFLEQEPYQIFISAYVCPEHEFKNLSYVALNSNHNVAYVRELRVNHEPVSI